MKDRFNEGIRIEDARGTLREACTPLGADVDFNNYSKVDDIDGEDHLVSQESSKSQGIAKQKVLTTSSRKPTNISAAFTNTLILSFIIGSFFGVVFLAIYLKVMH